jgi:hypothetical protein
MIACLQQGRDDIGIDRKQAGADPFQDRLDAVSEFGEGRQTHHGRGPLEAMCRAKGLIEVRTVALTSLEIHQSLFETDQELTRFLVKHLAKTVVRAGTAAQIR